MTEKEQVQKEMKEVDKLKEKAEEQGLKTTEGLIVKENGDLEDMWLYEEI